MTGKKNSPRQVLAASLIGTTIEFYDFYLYATAAVLVFPTHFFPGVDPMTAQLQSLASFALAFFARPVGSAVFGHFGDRIGRKATLVAALLTMGLSTILIGLLPTYAQIGLLAPVLLCLLRFGQGFGLGGEWGGAVLLAIENAPPGRRAWFGMFPQLGAPLGFLCSTGIFMVLTANLSDAQFMSWGWRVPFLLSAVLVLFGLYVRLRLEETQEFARVVASREIVRVPFVTLLRSHGVRLLLGACAAVSTFVIFYLMTVFTLSWAVSSMGFTRERFLSLQLVGVLFFAATIPLSARLADRHGCRPVLIGATLAILAFGLAFAPLFAPATTTAALATLCLGLGLMGLIYGPVGTFLASLFPTALRYTGASLAFNLAGILGASLAPYLALRLAETHGLQAVGAYLAASAGLTAIALLLLREPRAT